jgi:hypothetical protein
MGKRKSRQAPELSHALTNDNLDAAAPPPPSPSAAALLIERCRALGFRLEIEYGEVILYHPRGADVAALMEVLNAHEPEVIRLLVTGADEPATAARG